MNAIDRMKGIFKSEKYSLMHGNIECAIFELNNLEVVKFEVRDEYHLPLSFLNRNYSKLDNMRLWLKNRSIPKNRDYYDRIMINLKNINSIQLILWCKGLRVTDNYWIKKFDSDETFNDVTFFKNKSSELLDRIYIESDLFNKEYDVNEKTVLSPNFTSEGSLPKIWKWNNMLNNWTLYKCNRYYNEVDNEVLWHRVLEIFGVKHIAYWIDEYSDNVCAVSENYCNINREFVSAYELSKVYKENNQKSMKQNLCDYCKSINIDMEGFLNIQLVFDYLLANADRHWNNFGVIRDPSTLNIQELMPIYDNGNSLYFKTDLRYTFVDPNLNFTERDKTTKECLKYVTNYDFFRNHKELLSDLPEIVHTLRFDINNYYQKERADRERTKVKQHVDYILSLIN